MGRGKSYALAHAKLYVQNDATSLYLLADVTADKSADTQDGVRLVVDVDRNGAVTPQVDLSYQETTEGFKVARFLGPGRLGSQAATASALGNGFGASPGGATAHRIYEVALSLPEIGVRVGDVVRLGFQIISGSPAFTEVVPAGGMTSFSGLLKYQLVQRRLDFLVLTHQDYHRCATPIGSA